MSVSGSKIPVVVAAILAILLALTFLLRLPCPRVEGIPAGAARITLPVAGAPNVTGPTAAAVRAAVERAIPWLEQTRVRPAQEGLGRFRFYVMEVYCWFLLYAFADDPVQKERYRSEVVERLQLLGDGRPLVAFLQAARMPNVIADLLILVLMAQGLETPLPAVAEALPWLYQLGLDEPQRPIGLQIPLAWLASSVGLQPQPSLEQLRAEGMLQSRPREVTMKSRDVYYFTHEIYGLTDYGMRRGDFAPEEQAYLERTLPFWSKLNVILNQSDLSAEIAICHQAAGTTHTDGYGDGMQFLLESQCGDGAFGESRMDSDLPSDVRLGYLHTTMVALHALLAHESLLLKGSLPGWPRSPARPSRGE